MTQTSLADFAFPRTSVPGICLEAFRIFNKERALGFKDGDNWSFLSGEEVISRVKNIGFGLSAMGLGAGDRVAVISENRPEWSLTDLAILSLRAANVPIYTTQAVDQIRYILENSGAKMLIISGKKIWKHAEEAIRSVERLEKIIVLDADAKPIDDARAVTLAEVESAGEREVDDQIFSRRLAEIGNDDLATIIYTSGTTGEPK